MHHLNRFSFTVILPMLLLFCTVASPSGDRFVIRNPRSGLVLEATGTPVLLQRFTGSRSQIWKLEATSRGVFYIVNQRSGLVMDVSNKIKLKSARVIVAKKTGSRCQLWHINSDNTIANVCGDFALDIYARRYVRGNYIITWTRHSSPNQKFVLQFFIRKSVTINKE